MFLDDGDGPAIYYSLTRKPVLVGVYSAFRSCGDLFSSAVHGRVANVANILPKEGKTTSEVEQIRQDRSIPSPSLPSLSSHSPSFPSPSVPSLSAQSTNVPVSSVSSSNFPDFSDAAPSNIDFPIGAVVGGAIGGAEVLLCSHCDLPMLSEAQEWQLKC